MTSRASSEKPSSNSSLAAHVPVSEESARLLRNFLLAGGMSGLHAPESTPPTAPPPPPPLPVDQEVHALLFDNHIYAVVEEPGWRECHLCSRAGQRKRFELGDTLWTHLRGGQHQRELLRMSQPEGVPLPREIRRISDNEFTCAVCRCGTISGHESAKAHVRGVKHVKALNKARAFAAPTVGSGEGEFGGSGDCF